MKDRGVWVIVFLFSLLQFANSKQYHVSTTGSSSGDGSLNNPWDINYALSRTQTITGGDTVSFHAGTYKGNWDVYLSGSQGNYVTLMPYNNEPVILDGIAADDHHATIDVRGNYVIVKDLRITNSMQNRYSSQPGSDPSDYNETNGVAVEGDYVKIINCIVDNSTGTGIGSGVKAIGTEIYGNIVYHFGWQGSDRGHAHGIYCKNTSGLKKIKNNISFNGFQYPLQVGGTNTGSVIGFEISGNVGFGDGVLQNEARPEGVFIIGGGVPTENVTVSNNYLYQPNRATNLQLGYSESTINKEIIVDNNVFAGGYYSVEIRKFADMQFTNNVLVAGYRNVRMLGVSDLSSYNWSNNEYYYNTTSSFHYNGTTSSFSSWKSNTGLDSNSEAISGKPSNIIRIEPNAYETNRAHIIVFNYETKSSVSVDLSSILDIGIDYEIRDVENLMGRPVLEGTYTGGAISLPMHFTTLTAPVAPTPSVPSHTSIEFGVFIVKAKSPTYTVIETPCSIDITSITNTSDKDVTINYTTNGDCSDIDAFIYNSSNELIQTIENINNNYTIDMHNDCNNCTSGVYDIILKNSKAETSATFTYSAPECIDLTVTSFEPERISNSLTVNLCTFIPGNVTCSITNSSNVEVNTLSYLINKGVNDVIIPFDEFADGNYTVAFSDGENTTSIEVYKESPVEPISILSYTPNVTIDSTFITFFSPTDQTVDIAVKDSNGNEVLSRSFTAKPSDQNSTYVNLSGFTAGNYTVTISDVSTSDAVTITKNDPPRELEMLSYSPEETYNDVNIIFYSPREQTINIKVINSNNQERLSQNIVASQGDNNTSLDLSALDLGTYTIIIDDNSTIDFFNISRISEPRNLEILSFSPKLTYEDVTIDLYSPINQTINIEVINSNNEQMLSQKYVATEGENNEVTIDFRTLPEDDYTVIFIDYNISDFFTISRITTPRTLEITKYSTLSTFSDVDIDFYSPKNQTINIEVMNENYAQVINQNYIASVGEGNSATIDFTELPQGDYTVMLNGDENTDVLIVSRVPEPRTLEVINFTPESTFDNVDLTFYSPVDQEVFIKVINNNEDEVTSITTVVVEGENHSSLDFSNLDLGYYTVVIDDEVSMDQFSIAKIAPPRSLEVISYTPGSTINTFSINYYSPKSQDVLIALFGASKTPLLQKSFSSQSGEGNNAVIDISDFEEGEYSVVVRDVESSDSFSIYRDKDPEPIEVISYQFFPTNDSLSMVFFSPKNEDVLLSVLDKNDNTILTESISAYAGDANIFTSILKEIKVGEYTVALSNQLSSDSFVLVKENNSTQEKDKGDNRSKIKIIKHSPSPTSDLISLVFYSPINNYVDIVIEDKKGKQFHESYHAALVGINNTIELDINDLDDGEYILKIKDEVSSDSFNFEKLNESRRLEITLVTPNPTNGPVDIKFFSPKDNLIRFNLYNSDGVLLFSEYYEAEAGYDNIVHMEIPGPSEGYYLLQIFDGQTLDIYRIIREQ